MLNVEQISESESDMTNNKFFLHNEFGGFSNSILVNKLDNGHTVIKLVEGGRPWNTFVLDSEEVKNLINFLSGKGE
jgi:hypothetical protein